MQIALAALTTISLVEVVGSNVETYNPVWILNKGRSMGLGFNICDPHIETANVWTGMHSWHGQILGHREGGPKHHKKTGRNRAGSIPTTARLAMLGGATKGQEW